MSPTKKEADRLVHLMRLTRTKIQNLLEPLDEQTILLHAQVEKLGKLGLFRPREPQSQQKFSPETKVTRHGILTSTA